MVQLLLSDCPTKPEHRKLLKAGHGAGLDALMSSELRGTRLLTSTIYLGL